MNCLYGIIYLLILYWYYYFWILLLPLLKVLNDNSTINKIYLIDNNTNLCINNNTNKYNR